MSTNFSCTLHLLTSVLIMDPNSVTNPGSGSCNEGSRATVLHFLDVPQRTTPSPHQWSSVGL